MVRPSVILLLLLLSFFSSAEPLRIAVASSFKPAAQLLTQALNQQRGQDLEVELISGSSATLAQQIRAGAPYHLFLSADVANAERLVQQQVAQQLQIYAYGDLVYWRFDRQIKPLSEHADDELLAIANARVAPYGAAALQAFTQLGLAARLQPQLVVAPNLAQAFQYAYSGAAAAVIVPSAYLQALGAEAGWPLPKDSYAPIAQALVVVQPHPALQEWRDYLLSPEGQQLLQRLGYVNNR